MLIGNHSKFEHDPRRIVLSNSYPYSGVILASWMILVRVMFFKSIKCFCSSKHQFQMDVKILGSTSRSINVAINLTNIHKYSMEYK